MNSAISTPRLAASVILVRDAPFEVLLVKRNDRGPFASAYVFPGGVLDPEDRGDYWSRYVHAGALSTEERAIRITACREAWEEVGLVPGQAAGTNGTRVGPFCEYVLRHDLRLDLTALVFFSHWITPIDAAKRFDTYFFICHAPDQMAECDGTETVALQWIEPARALEDAQRGARSFLLPTRENLKKLAESRDCAEAIAAARTRIISPITPQSRDRR